MFVCCSDCPDDVYSNKDISKDSLFMFMTGHEFRYRKVTLKLLLASFANNLL